MRFGLGFGIDTGRRGFTPRSLFAANEQGGWYDPSDFSSMYQDSAGTTPVTALGQPVGLMLDKRLGLAVGSERISNGNFSTSTTGWTLTAAGASTVTPVSGGVRVYSPSGDTAALAQTPAVAFENGVKYLVEFDVTMTAGVGYAFLGDTSAAASRFTFSTSGRKRAILTKGSTSSTFGISREAAGADFIVDNISVRELPGNHAAQPTSGNRPTVEARVNLLTKTSLPAEWTYTNSPTVTLGVADPFGGTAAVTITDDDTLTSRYISLPTVATATENVSRQFSVYVKKQAGNAPALIRAMHTGGTQVDARACINTTTGQVTAVASCTATSFAHIAADGGEWWRVTLTATSSGNTSIAVYLYAGAALGTTSIASAHVGTNTYAFPQLAVSGDLMRDVYQRVNTATDYADIGAPRYLEFDGATSNRWLQTSSVNFTGTDKMTVLLGARKNTDSAAQTIVELSATTASNNGSFAVTAAAAATTNYQFTSKGTTAGIATASSIVAPNTSVICATGDISGDSAVVRVNGAQAASSATDQGSGTFGNFPLYIGRRGGTTQPFNGRLYGLIVRGAASNAGQIAAGEAWMNSKTRAY